MNRLLGRSKFSTNEKTLSVGSINARFRELGNSLQLASGDFEALWRETLVTLNSNREQMAQTMNRFVQMASLLLSIVDSLDSRIGALKKTELAEESGQINAKKDLETETEVLELIRGRAVECLTSCGIIEMSTHLGDRYDPRLHTPLGPAKKSSTYPIGTISKVVQRGFVLRESDLAENVVIRPALVEVSNGSRQTDQTQITENQKELREDEVHTRH
jgi:molecular chaperone GrpE (heat shock protein)